MERSIEDLLNNEPEPEVEPEVQEEVTTEAAPEPEAPAEGPARDESGRFAPKQTGEQPQGEPEPTPGTNPIPEDQFKGYLTEKRKRQELEQQLEAMQQQIARQQQPQAQKPPTADFWTDPQAFLATQFDQFGHSMLERFKQQQQVERIEASETAAKAKYTDYGDAFRAFQQAAMANPALVQQMTSASDPAEFAYTKGKSALELERYGSVDELLKAERAKWEAEARAAIPTPAQSFPQSTAADGSVGARSGPEWAGPTPIGKLIG